MTCGLICPLNEPYHRHELCMVLPVLDSFKCDFLCDLSAVVVIEQSSTFMKSQLFVKCLQCLVSFTCWLDQNADVPVLLTKGLGQILVFTTCLFCFIDCLGKSLICLARVFEILCQHFHHTVLLLVQEETAVFIIQYVRSRVLPEFLGFCNIGFHLSNPVSFFTVPQLPSTSVRLLTA